MMSCNSMKLSNNVNNWRSEMPHYDLQCAIALKALSVESSLCVVCSCINTFNSLLLVHLVGYFSTFSQLTVFSVCHLKHFPSSLLSKSLHPFFLCFWVLLPLSRPPATLFLRRFYSHEVCIPHLLCRLHTKEQKAPLLTCGKHSSPLGPYAQPESPILS